MIEPKQINPALSCLALDMAETAEALKRSSARIQEARETLELVLDVAPWLIEAP